MRGFLHIFIATLLMAQNAFADSGDKGAKWPDCFCTDRGGERVELGELTCLNVDGRQFIARCEMSLNVPMWRDQGEGCSMSRAPLDRLRAARQL